MASAATPLSMLSSELTADVCQRALRARDPRFDGLFFVGITTTGVYCRPVCPARVTYPERRRFFSSAAAAEHAGFRPCLRCRPELAPGRALCDAVSRLAGAAAHRIAAGALNGRSVAELARELCVGERHLRRALERELGVSPLELAQTHRLLLAKQLLADTELSITRIAFASGFQSVRRFNTVFREHYRMPPSALRGASRARRGVGRDPGHDLLRLTLAYRPPFAWAALLTMLGREAIPGVAVVEGRRYGHTVRLGGQCGVVFAQDAASLTPDQARAATGARPQTYVNIDVACSLVPVLMPLLARLRQLFDLDAEPLAVDTHLAKNGLGSMVRRRPGLRIAGTLDGFEVALRVLMDAATRSRPASTGLLRRIVQALGEPLETGTAALAWLAPDADRIADAGAAKLAKLAVPARAAETITAVARLIANGALNLEPGRDVAVTHSLLTEGAGVPEEAATMIVLRALRWPDAFPAADCALQHGARVRTAEALLARAEQWRPWRAYAALHFWLDAELHDGAATPRRSPSCPVFTAS